MAATGQAAIKVAAVGLSRSACPGAHPQLPCRPQGSEWDHRPLAHM
jgi:hypothetical protein